MAAISGTSAASESELAAASVRRQVPGPLLEMGDRAGRKDRQSAAGDPDRKSMLSEGEAPRGSVPNAEARVAAARTSVSL